MVRHPLPSLYRMNKELHHHVRYLEIDGEDVVCHLKWYIHENIHYALPYTIEKNIVIAAGERLRKEHDRLKHISFEEMIIYYKSRNISINLGDDFTELIKWATRNPYRDYKFTIQADDDKINTSSANKAFYLILPQLLKKYMPYQIFYRGEYDLCPVCLRKFKQQKYQTCPECYGRIGFE